MRLLLVQKEGTDLYSTLRDSETSRTILRFYHPKKTAWGVCIDLATLGSALSLVSELKWYLQRYVTLPLLILSNGTICTTGYAQIIYGREDSVHHEWNHEILFGITNGTLRGQLSVSPDSAINIIEEFSEGKDTVFKARCCEEEW